ncbi:MAG: NAD(P)-dependent oxidoreductase [Actinobacteria bacterium]|nr:NAD(P)-dependent oxidoreductase [Actinomycetota bacterium]
MGAPMAAHLAAARPTLVWNRTSSVAEAHAASHGSRDVPLDAIAEAEVIVSCLSRTVDVVDVARQVAGDLRPGTVWVDCTSGEPEPSRVLATRLGEHGVAYLDAPVSGGTAGAEAGTLTVMAGGDADVLERVRPVLAAFAGRIVHVGPVGAGHAVKAVNNTLLAANLWAAGEGLVALVRAGVPATTALEVINASSGRSFPTEVLIPERVVTREFPVTFTLGLLAKDVGIARGVLDAAGSPAPVLRQVAELLTVALRELGPDVDHVAALQLVERWAGSEIR